MCAKGEDVKHTISIYQSMWRSELDALRTDLGAQAPVTTINTPDGLRYALVVTGVERAKAREVAALAAEMIEVYNTLGKPSYIAPVGHEEETNWI